MSVKRHPLIILAKGLGTRMAISKPKTLVKLKSDQTILARLLQEAALAETIEKVILFVRQDSSELRKVVTESSLPIEVVFEEPEGYFRDLISAKKKFNLNEFSIVDSDLVVPKGEFARFLSQASKTPAWLTIGVTSFPEELSGRPTWAEIDSDGYIRNMSRSQPMPYRTVGVFHWSDTALDIESQHITAEASIMAYITEHLQAGHAVKGLHFSRTVNVNTKEDIAAANKLIALG